MRTKRVAITILLFVLPVVLRTQALAETENRIDQLQKSGDEFTQTGDLIKADKVIDQLEGVYKKSVKFAGEAISNNKPYTQEDVLELVRIDKNALYIRTRLHFANGHFCSFYGVGRYNLRGSFAVIYKGEDSGVDASCKIEVESDTARGKVFLNSVNCGSTWCGARGILIGNFDSKSKQKIRYMDRLKNSLQYKTSLDGYKKLSGQTQTTSANLLRRHLSDHHR